MLFDITHQAFTHGHLYVALSRITKYDAFILYLAVICHFQTQISVVGIKKYAYYRYGIRYNMPHTIETFLIGILFQNHDGIF